MKMQNRNLLAQSGVLCVCFPRFFFCLIPSTQKGPSLRKEKLTCKLCSIFLVMCAFGISNMCINDKTGFNAESKTTRECFNKYYFSVFLSAVALADDDCAQAGIPAGLDIKRLPGFTAQSRRQHTDDEADIHVFSAKGFEIDKEKEQLVTIWHNVIERSQRIFPLFDLLLERFLCDSPNSTDKSIGKVPLDKYAAIYYYFYPTEAERTNSYWEILEKAIVHYTFQNSDEDLQNEMTTAIESKEAKSPILEVFLKRGKKSNQRELYLPSKINNVIENMAKEIEEAGNNFTSRVYVHVFLRCLSEIVKKLNKQKKLSRPLLCFTDKTIYQNGGKVYFDYCYVLETMICAQLTAASSTATTFPSVLVDDAVKKAKNLNTVFSPEPLKNWKDAKDKMNAILSLMGDWREFTERCIKPSDLDSLRGALQEQNTKKIYQELAKTNFGDKLKDYGNSAGSYLNLPFLVVKGEKLINTLRIFSTMFKNYVTASETGEEQNEGQVTRAIEVLSKEISDFTKGFISPLKALKEIYDSMTEAKKIDAEELRSYKKKLEEEILNDEELKIQGLGEILPVFAEHLEICAGFCERLGRSYSFTSTATPGAQGAESQAAKQSKVTSKKKKSKIRA